MTRLIAAIDGSAAARPVLELGMRLAGVLSSDLEAVHVDEGDVTPARELAQAYEIPTTILRGERVPSLLEVMTVPDVTMGLMGLRGSLGGRQPAGSTTLHVIERSTKPLVVVPPEARPDPGPAMERRCCLSPDRLPRPIKSRR